MQTALFDPGKLIRAKHGGQCAECLGEILPNQPIYFSRLHGSRHKGCVEPAQPAAAEDVARRDARGDWQPYTGDDAPRGPAIDAAPPRARDGGEGLAAAATRETEFGRAGDRDAARRELAGVVRLLIDALTKIERLLS